MDSAIFGTFKIPLKNLRTFGLWQTKKSSWSYFIYGIFMHIIFIDLFTALQFAYLFSFETFEDFANLMSMLPTYTALCLKSINWFYNLNAIEALFDRIQDNLDCGFITEKLLSHGKRTSKIFKVFWASAAASCILGAFVPVISHTLPYRMWFPYEYDNNLPMFWLGAIYQIVNTLCYSGVDIVLDTFPVFFMGFILGMVEQLSDRLEALKKQTAATSIENKKELLKCIKYQLNILEITRRVERFFSMVFLLRGLMSTLILCTTSYALTIVSKFEIL